MPPKLLVVLDTWRAAAAIRTGQLSESPEIGTMPRLRSELLLLSLGEGPVLYAGASDFESRLQEITAAIAAMQ